MASGISTSREDLKRFLDRTAQQILDTYGVEVWFAEIMGRRWSYLAGRKQGGATLLPPHRIELTGRYGLVSDGWERIPAGRGEAIVSSLREAIRGAGVARPGLGSTSVASVSRLR